MNKKDIKFAYFGTSDVSVEVLKILKENELIPQFVVTGPDKPRGRKMEITPPPVKVWAEENNIGVLQPEEITEDFISQLKERAPEEGWDVFVVVAYGVILPKELLSLPERGSINLHYSLLPKLRGPAPVEGALLEDEIPTGVTTILMDEKMDHGPILMQEVVDFDKWPESKKKMFQRLNKVGGELLAETIEYWVEDEIDSQEQEHDEATYTKLIKKEDAEINLNDNPEENLRKIYAYQGWPKPYFFDDGERVIVKEAHIEEGELKIDKVVPEGKDEMTWNQYQNWHKNT